MFGCAGLGVLGCADLFLRRFKGSVSVERFGSRTRTVKRVKLDVKRSRQDSSILDGGDGPSPNTARPEGGCLIIRRHYQCLLPSWLKALLAERVRLAYKYTYRIGATQKSKRVIIYKIVLINQLRVQGLALSIGSRADKGARPYINCSR